MKLITISGLDGSGKSSQIKLLQDYLESQGRKVFYFHAVQSGIATKITEFRNKYCLICKFTNKCKIKKEESVTKAGLATIFLRRIFLMVDLLRFKMLNRKLNNSSYDCIISDRYFYDNAVNIKYLSRNDKTLPCEKFIIKPNFAIYLQTTPEIIMQRERKPDQGLEYLKKKKEIYDKYAPVWNLKIIDGNRSKEEVFEEIKSKISNSPNF